MVKVKKTLEMHGWKSLGPRLASLHGPAENIKNIQDHSSLAVQQFTITSIFQAEIACRGGRIAGEWYNWHSHLNVKEAEAKIATTFCFAFFCASHSFGKLSSDSPPRYDFMRFSPATLRSAPSAQDCGRVTGSFEDHLAHEASISSW